MERSGEQFVDCLLREGTLNREQVHQLEEWHDKTKASLEHGLLALGIMEEQSLAERLAEHFNLRLLTESDLKNYDVPSEVLGLIPPSIAQTKAILPLLWDRENSSLDCATAFPDRRTLIGLIQHVVGVSRVNQYVTTRSGLLRAIGWYYNSLEHDPPSRTSQTDWEPETLTEVTPDRNGSRDRVLVLEADPNLRTAIGLLLARHGMEMDGVSEESELVRQLKIQEYERVVVRTSAVHSRSDLEQLLMRYLPRAELSFVDDFSESLLGRGTPFQEWWRSYQATVLLLLRLLQPKPSSRYYFIASFADCVRQTCQVLDTPASMEERACMAAFLYALSRVLHAELLSAGVTSEGEQALLAVRLANLLKAPDGVENTLYHLQEHFDGSGRPEGLRGEQIPWSSRILLVARDFLFLLHGTKSLEVNEVFARLRHHAGRRYDSKVVEALYHLIQRQPSLSTVREPRGLALIVDPDSEQGAYLELLCLNEGYQAKVFENGMEALEYAEKRIPQVIFSEVTLPGIDGFTLCRRVKTHPRLQAIPFFFVSKRHDPLSVKKGFQLGADGYHSKPLQPSSVLARLEETRTGTRNMSVTSTAQSESSNQSLEGFLEEFSVAELCYWLGTCSTTALLRLQQEDGETGQLSFCEGGLVHAESAGSRGEGVVTTLTSWQRGTFRLLPGMRLLRSEWSLAWGPAKLLRFLECSSLEEPLP